MPYRYQYEAEASPIGDLTPLVPKMGWQGVFPAMVPAVMLMTAACASTQGTSTYIDFPVPVVQGIGGHPRLGSRIKFQYIDEVSPIFIAPRVAKLGWAPKYDAIVPTAPKMHESVRMSSGAIDDAAEFFSVTKFVPKLSWGPSYPDFALGPRPLPIHPSMFSAFPPGQLPLDAKFMAWDPEYPSIVPGPRPLPNYSDPSVISFAETTRVFDHYTVRLLINGTDRSSSVVAASIRIDNYLNEQPDTLTFTTVAGSGLIINGGEDIRVTVNTGLGPAINTLIIFGGTIIAPQQIAQELRANVAFVVTCQDYTYMLNKHYPLKRYVSQSATAIIQDMIGFFSPGFTFGHVQANMPVVSIDFDGTQTFASCMTSLMNLVGGYWFPSYTKDMWAFTSYSAVNGTPPTAIDESNAASEFGAHNLKYDKDISQIRTRINLFGASATVDLGVTSATGAYALPITSTTIPLNQQTPFASGFANVGPQRIQYSGTSVGATLGSLSSGIPQAPSPIGLATVLTAPVISQNGSSIGPSGNLSAGAYSYLISYVNEKGDESEPSVAAANCFVSAAPVPSPPSATFGNAAGNMGAGTFQYKIGYKTSNGETLPSSIAAVGIPQVPAPQGFSQFPVSGVRGNLPAGNYQYKISFKTANGETIPAGWINAQLNIPQISPGSSSILGFNGTAGAGNVPIGFHQYAVSDVDNLGETGNTGNWYQVTNNAISSVQISISGSTDPRVTSRKIYRQIGGQDPSTFFLVATLSGNGSGTVTDTLSDAQALSQPSTRVVNTSGSGQFLLSGIPTTADQRVIARVIYRLEPGSPQYYKIATINDNFTNTYTDNLAVPNSSREIPQSSSTADNGQVNLTNLPTTFDARVTSREIYRTRINLTSFQHLASVPLKDVNGNFITTYTDNAADSSLGNPPPVVSTADNGAVQLTGIPVGPAQCTSRKVYRIQANGSSYKYAFTISDNFSQSWIDNTSDTSLGDVPKGLSQWRERIGSTILYVEDLSKFPEPSGWVKVNSQVLYYNSKAGSALVGIPASGLGSMTADVTFETQVLGMPFLKGVTGLVYPLTHGETVAISIQVDDFAAQAALAAIEGGDGVHEFTIVDTSLATPSQLLTRGLAELILFKSLLKSLEYDCRDFNTRAGADIVVNLLAPTNISVTLKIQSVSITQLGMLMRTPPLFTVKASATKFTLQDILRQLTIGG